jgi:NAD(P)-dependent dehydrogenase (short-subunit alcohol dehydrogenase family)
MGLAMAEQLLDSQNYLVCISRQANAQLAASAAVVKAPLEQWQLDLEESIATAEQLSAWLGQHTAKSFASATLINNAGLIPPIAPLSDSEPTELARALRVGLEAPMLLTATFLRTTEPWGIARRVLNISSGLGRRAMASQSAYCAAKAGMDHFTRCLALDEARKLHGAKVCSLAPGVIDTDMQVQLRGAPESSFPDHAGFVQLKDNGLLTSPPDAAARVLAYLARAGFGSSPVADVRE